MTIPPPPPSKVAKKIHIIFILGETFFDTENLKSKVKYSGDATPCLHSLQKKFPSGIMQSPYYGWGTANVEFEVLTGFSNYFLPIYPYIHILPHLEKSPSLAWYFLGKGFETIGLHSFYGYMYKRSEAYPSMGFQRFLDIDSLKFDSQYSQSRQTDGNYVPDGNFYDRIISILDTAKANLFISAITMQNHSPYNNRYAKENRRFEVQSDLLDTAQKEKIENYMELLYTSDSAICALTDSLSNADYNVAILFYGDHLPSIYPDSVFADTSAKNKMYQTPYFFWSNFQDGYIELPAVSPNQLSTLFLDWIGEDKPPFYIFLDSLRKNYPILTQTYLDSSAKADVILDDYKMLHYDMLFGEQFGWDMFENAWHRHKFISHGGGGVVSCKEDTNTLTR